MSKSWIEWIASTYSDSRGNKHASKRICWKDRFARTQSVTMDADDAVRQRTNATHCASRSWNHGCVRSSHGPSMRTKPRSGGGLTAGVNSRCPRVSAATHRNWPTELAR